MSARPPRATSRASGRSTPGTCRSTGFRATVHAARSGRGRRRRRRRSRRLLAGATRVHAVEAAWLDRIRQAAVVAYRLPEASFRPDPEVGGYWLSRVPVEPLEVVELGDLLALHAAAEIELRIVVEPLAALGSRRRVDARVQRDAAAQRAAAAELGERPLLRHPGASRKAGWRRSGLPENEETVVVVLQLRSQARGDRGHRAPAPRSRRPRGSRPRPPRPAGGRARRRSAVSRAPWRARSRTDRSAAPPPGPRRPRRSGALEQSREGTRTCAAPPRAT